MPPRQRTPPAAPVAADALLARPRLTSETLLRPLKTAETVARDVVDEIVSRGLQTGDRLPPEAVMIKQYGVSRESFREGLRLLEVQGLITIRRGVGGGPFVGTVDSANLGRVSTLYYHLAGGTYADLFDAQAVAEGVLAERAASNLDRTAVHDAMAPFVGRARPDEHLDDPAEYLEEHVNFHVVVARLAANPVLEMLLKTLTQIVGHHVAVVADPRDVRDEIEHSHIEIAETIIAGEASEARALMERHTRNVATFYVAEMGPQVNDLIEWL
jgi:GntR family transcriptional regulator, transcriptional repressor for pyruvate dehydrogenase complex